MVFLFLINSKEGVVFFPTSYFKKSNLTVFIMRFSKVLPLQLPSKLPKSPSTIYRPMPTDLFQEFPPVSKTEWLRQISKDLKDKSLDDLNWQAPGGLTVSPFVHADDFPEPVLPLEAEPNQWEIGELVHVGDPTMANRQALEALEGGVEGLCFQLETALDAGQFEALFQGIHPDYIGLHFEGAAVQENPGMVLGNLEILARQKGLSTALLRGSLAYDPVPVSKIVDWRYLADLLVYARERFPGFKIIQLSTPELRSGEGAKHETAFPEQSSGVLVRNANTYLEKLSERGVPVEHVVEAMQFSVQVGKSYFWEIARLRALKILWLNVLKAWDAPLISPTIVASLQPQAYSDDLYTNMIRATTMAMAAVQGGAVRLTVLPYDAGRELQATYPTSFGRRIARNVQHLLKMESGMDAIPDPAAGSYYIEALTRQMAEKAWEEFAG